jgi:hypothetical protein
MGALKNARKRQEKRATAGELRTASEIHRARLARQQTTQVANMCRPGGYYGAPFPDEVEKDQAAYVDGKGRKVTITPENVGKVSRFVAGRPAKVHTKYLPEDSSPGLVAVAPTGEESRRIRDVKASDVYHRNAITPPYPGPKHPYQGAQVRTWAASTSLSAKS